jgi:hypothetical protein
VAASPLVVVALAAVPRGLVVRGVRQPLGVGAVVSPEVLAVAVARRAQSVAAVLEVLPVQVAAAQEVLAARLEQGAVAALRHSS